MNWPKLSQNSPFIALAWPLQTLAEAIDNELHMKNAERGLWTRLILMMYV